MRKPPPRGKPEKLSWDVYAKQGEIHGRARGKALATKYIAEWVASHRGLPLTPETIQAACEWIEYHALEELNNAPGWDSLSLTIYRFSPISAEGRALDMRIWRAFQSSAVRTIREILTAYGCTGLRFLDMDAFVRYYRSEDE